MVGIKIRRGSRRRDIVLVTPPCFMAFTSGPGGFCGRNTTCLLLAADRSHPLARVLLSTTLKIHLFAPRTDDVFCRLKVINDLRLSSDGKFRAEISGKNLFLRFLAVMKHL